MGRVAVYKPQSTKLLKEHSNKTHERNMEAIQKGRKFLEEKKKKREKQAVHA